MKLMPLKTSLMALALFAYSAPGIASAAGSSEPGTMVVAQADDDSATGSQRIDAIRKFIQRGRNLSKLEDARLQKRLKRAQRFQNTPDLPADLAQGLEQEIAELNTEIARRQAGGTQSGSTQSDDAQSTGDASVDTGEQQATDQSGSGQATTSAAQSGSVAEFLSSVRPVADLDNKALRAQLRKAAGLAKAQGVSKDDHKRLRQVMRDARAEMSKRKDGSTPDAQNTDNSAGQQPDTTTATNAGTDNASQPSSNAVVDVTSEQQALAILNDQTDASTMNKADLRKRLATMRDLLSANKLSPETNKALRQKLATERTMLRRVVGKDAAGNGQGTGGSDSNTTVNNVTINNDVTINQTTVKVVLADRRPSADLRDDELRGRINVYRKVVIDLSYSEPERLKWRTMMERDRVLLRQRMLDSRRARAAKLKTGGKDINIDLSIDFKPGRPVPPRSVFAAEADDQELTDVLAAPPRRKLERKYTVEEVETDPQLRDAVARIEIDTVHFGFGEGFLREEEIDNLDRIAEIMEQILAVNPGEVFMIEGHTDAVGSDPANLELSRERAKAVKQALTTYFVIPAENLKTVGFGERYLKIPTADAEAENRRVSIARITALVGALDQ